MFLEIFLSLIVGIIAGTFTGLIPGIHINLISVVLVSLSGFLLEYVPVISLAVFIITMSVTHTFLDCIPSIFLGAPDSDQALGVLPGHKMLLKGEGYGAVYLTVIGSFGGLLLAIALVPFLIKFVGIIYPIIRNYIAYFLILIVVFMIFREKLKLWALLLFLISGLLGSIVLSQDNLSNPLFPMLSGLFGVSTLALSYMDKVVVPPQIIKAIKLKSNIIIMAILSSTFAGTLASFLPGLGSSQAAVMASQITKDIGDKGFLILIGGVNTVNMVLSLVTLFVLNKARNGSVVAISELMTINFNELIILLLTAAVTGIIGVFLALNLAKIFSKIIPKINYRKLVISIVSLITFLTFFLSGYIGFLILTISAFIGIIAPIKGISRSHAMGCLMLPVIIYLI